MKKEPKMKRILNVGDEVWTAQAAWLATPIPCPVCAGTTKLLVKPVGRSDEEGSVVTCDYCKIHDTGQAYHAPGTVVEIWSWKPLVQKIRVERVVASTGAMAAEPEYHFNVTSCSWCCVPKNWFETEAEALAAAKKMAADADEKSVADRMDVVRDKRSRGWTVGYSKRNIRELEEKLKWHLAQINKTAK